MLKYFPQILRMHLKTFSVKGDEFVQIKKILQASILFSRAGIFKQSMGARNRVIVLARQATKTGGIDPLESIPGLHKRLKIRAQVIFYLQTSSTSCTFHSS